MLFKKNESAIEKSIKMIIINERIKTDIVIQRFIFLLVNQISDSAITIKQDAVKGAIGIYDSPKLLSQFFELKKPANPKNANTRIPME